MHRRGREADRDKVGRGRGCVCFSHSTTQASGGEMGVLSVAKISISISTALPRKISILIPTALPRKLPQLAQL